MAGIAISIAMLTAISSTTDCVNVVSGFGVLGLKSHV